MEEIECLDLFFSEISWTFSSIFSYQQKYIYTPQLQIDLWKTYCNVVFIIYRKYNKNVAMEILKKIINVEAESSLNFLLNYIKQNKTVLLSDDLYFLIDSLCSEKFISEGNILGKFL